MNQINIKIKPIFFILAVCFIANSILFAQSPLAKLELGKLIESEIIKSEPKQFTIYLGANQTARIEVEYQGLNVLINAYDPSGEMYLKVQSPTGRSGKKVLLLTAEKSGEHKIEVKPVHDFPRPIKFKIEVTEIRATIPDDNFINKTLARISVISKDEKLYQSMTLAERRNSIKRNTEVVELSKLIQNKNWQAHSLIILSHLYYLTGEIQSSLEASLQAREIYREIKDPYFEALATNSIGNLYKDTGDYERAISFYNETANLQKNPNRFDRAILAGNLAKAYALSLQFEKAIEFYQTSLDLYVEMKYLPRQGPTLGSLGQAYLAMGDYPKAIEYLQNGLKLSEEAKDRLDVIDISLSLGKAFWELERKEEAYKLFSEANLSAKKAGSRSLIISSYYLLAIAEQDKGNIDEAVKYLESGLKIIEQIRSELRNKSSQTSYFATVQNLYELYTDLLIERSRKNDNTEDIELAFEMNERSRSRSLIDLLEEARVDFKQGVNTNLLEKEKDLNNAINDKYRTRERLLRRKSKQEEIDKINTEINGLEIELDKLNLLIQSENPRYADLTRGKTLSTDEIQKLLDNETVLLEYKLGKERSFLWIVTKDSIKVHELPDRETIEKQARKFYELTIANNRNEDVQRQFLSKELSKILLPEIASDIKGKRLAIVADGILQYLPFSALQDVTSKYLVDKNEIVILPSASVLAQLRENPNKANPNGKTIAIFADPVFDKGDSRISQVSNPTPKTQNVALQKVLRDFRFGEELPRLLASRQEANSIAGLVSPNKISVKTDFEADLKSVETANLKDYKIVHFATHGLLSTSQPELSGLVLSLYDKNGEPQDGFLSLNNIYNLNLSSDMVVLSACQTALGKDVRGEGLIGISRGFLYAGSNRIVASLWKVDDAATAEFMKRFYKIHLEKGMPASKALQQTKIEMKKIRRYSSPYYWSAFTLLGDWK